MANDTEPRTLTALELGKLLYLDRDRLVVGGRRMAKQFLMVRGYYANAETTDAVLDSIRTHPERPAIEAEFCRLILDGGDDED